MEQIATKPLRTGWSSRENALLMQQIAEARAARLPLRTAFDAVARQTGRCPNSVRNHYYTTLHPRSGAPAFVPFTEEEAGELLREVLLSCTRGESVRACTMRLAEGDTQRMLRYQNKYRSLLKTRPELVRKIRQELSHTAESVFDPYALPRQGPGRPRKNAPPSADTLRALLMQLCEGLMALYAHPLVGGEKSEEWSVESGK